MKYVEDLRQSCANALAFCRRALDKLKEVPVAVAALDGEGPGEGAEQPEAVPKAEETGAAGEQPKAVPEAESKARLAERSRRLQTAMRQMAKTYREIHKDIDRTVADDARWCRNVMERQIAHVSAGNYTEFDPAELVSAIAVSVSWRQLNTPLQVKDAVAKALEGARDDGSWGPGRPFYPHKDALGAWALTSDVVATLVGAIERYPEVEVADEALLQYVDWLERTRIQVDSEGTLVTGWASDRAPHHTRVDLWATCYAIEALLEIRDLLEFRLWQLCARRFTVIADVSPLGSIDPVDLGQGHIRRLHRRLYRMARMTQGDEFAKGDYSLVLHGPPGSSKTKVAEAISAEMWMSSSRWGERSPRLVRITPADFTRGGEERIDSEARIIFDLLRGVRGVTIFFDEIDDLLRRRDPKRHPSFIELVIPAMLNRLQDLRDACPRQEISFLIATNYIEKIEPALIRKGRIDEAIPVTYPDTESRLMMLDQGARQLEAELKGGSKKAKAAVRSGFVREGAEAVRGLSGAPWTAVNTLLKDARKAILEAYARGAASSPRLIFAREARELKAAVSPPDYAARRRAVVANSNLRREYFAQLWASRTYPAGLAFAVEAWSGLGGQGSPPPEFRHEALKFTTARLGQPTGDARTRTPGSGGGDGAGDVVPDPRLAPRATAGRQ